MGAHLHPMFPVGTPKPRPLLGTMSRSLTPAVARLLYRSLLALCLCAFCLCALCLHANTARATSPPEPVTADVEIVGPVAATPVSPSHKMVDASNVVVWLTPLDQPTALNSPGSSSPQVPQIVQRNKTFEPHILVVQVGTAVEFPNKDPFFHNIFSLFDGKRFDLGLYEAGSSRTVRFDRPGVSFLFCNIHPEMSAAVVAVETPYFGMSSAKGHVTIPNAPDGRYELNVWYERSLPADLKKQSREINISDSTRSLGVIRVIQNPRFTPAHKNKYGQDYVPPPSPGYTGYANP
jgi:plastocyanin